MAYVYSSFNWEQYMTQELKNHLKVLETPNKVDLAVGYNRALTMVDDIVLKNYVNDLSHLEVVPLSKDLIKRNLYDNVRLFKITKMVYEKDEFSSYKFASVFNTLTSSDSSIFIIVDSDGESTDFYMGIRAIDSNKSPSSLCETLKQAMIGQFPGIHSEFCDLEDIKRWLDQLSVNSISAVSTVANNRDEGLISNQNFVQGLEKLMYSMQGHAYTCVVLANGTDQKQVRELRKSYEHLYTQLSPFASMQINYGENKVKGISKSSSVGKNKTTTEGISRSESYSFSETKSITEENSTSKTLKAAGAVVGVVGGLLAPVTGGISLGVVGAISGSLTIAGSALSKTTTNGTSTTNSNSESVSQSTSEGISSTETLGSNLSLGLSSAMTLTAHDKNVEGILARIDKQLERMDEFESLGMYECAAYFMSEEEYVAEMAATTYKSIMRGENSGIEVSTTNTWNISSQEYETKIIEAYIKNFIHPVFLYANEFRNIEVTPCALVSGNELAIHMGLPRKSVRGLPVVEHADFAKEIVTYEKQDDTSGIVLGKIYSMGQETDSKVKIDIPSLAMHTFVTGSTGSGKSNTIYRLIKQAQMNGARFMVIEPAKGEYKHIFGNHSDVHVFGTNPSYSELLKINPFKFPDKVHVLEHVDRLIEIFNVCWPMYAAMPAVLKDAVLKSYEDCGWNLVTSKNKYDITLYPTFKDLEDALIHVINESAYSSEMKSNYIGSLVTRVKSLTNGLNGQIFTDKNIPSEILYDENVIIDLSRVGSMETKSLIIGLLIMGLSEYRISTSDSMNIPFKHMTVLEEAHNILKRTSTEQNNESPNLMGKSVEMISNAIAEMRTYGEGFVIVDQSPSAVDITAIRNTNTKIIMRLPDENDRRFVGKAAGLDDDQIDEIAKLPRGVAAVYQNDWIEPVLCKISRYKAKDEMYQYQAVAKLNTSTNYVKKHMHSSIKVDIEKLVIELNNADIRNKNKIWILDLAKENKKNKSLNIWNDIYYLHLAERVFHLLEAREWFGITLKKNIDISNLHKYLIEEVDARIYSLSQEYKIEVLKSLFSYFASYENSIEERYKEWSSYVGQKGIK